MSQAGAPLAADHKHPIKENSATSLDGRDLPGSPTDNQSNVLFAVQRCLSRHEIDRAKEEIIYDEHLNPKTSFVQQPNDHLLQEGTNDQDNHAQAAGASS